MSISVRALGSKPAHPGPADWSWHPGGHMGVSVLDCRRCREDSLLLAGVGIGVLAATVYIFNDWHSGFYVFIVWLMFEDLARKFLGNNMAITFGKDFLVAVIYVSCLLARRRRQFESFRPPFWLSLSLFFWLAVVQVFNSRSPSLLYGLLGLKQYFYYLPLMFVAYALIRSPEKLNRFLKLSVALATVISLIGLWQETMDVDFFEPFKLGSRTPRTRAPDTCVAVCRTN